MSCRNEFKNNFFKKKSYYYNGVFTKWNGNSVNWANLWNLKNHWSMNLGQYKDPILSYHMCLTFAVVASWSLTQEVAGSNHVTVMTNIYRPQGKVMFSQASVIVSTIGLRATRSLLILVTARSARIHTGMFSYLVSEFSELNENI